MGVPNIGWLIRENPSKMDDLGVPLFQETPVYTSLYSFFHDPNPSRISPASIAIAPAGSTAPAVSPGHE